MGGIPVLFLALGCRETGGGGEKRWGRGGSHSASNCSEGEKNLTHTLTWRQKNGKLICFYGYFLWNYTGKEHTNQMRFQWECPRNVRMLRSQTVVGISGIFPLWIHPYPHHCNIDTSVWVTTERILAYLFSPLLSMHKRVKNIKKTTLFQQDGVFISVHYRSPKIIWISQQEYIFNFFNILISWHKS